MRLTLYIIFFIASLVQLIAQISPVDSLTKALKKNNLTDSAKIATMIELSYSYAQISPDSSFNIATRALNLAREMEIKILEAWALNRISGYYWIKAKFPDAIKTAQESLQLFEEIGDDRGIADCYNVLGNTNAMDNDLERALEYYKKSLDKFSELGDIDAVSRGFSNVGRVNYMLGRYDTALYYMEQIKDILKGSNSISESIMYNTTGDIYQQLDRLKEALEYYKKGLEIAERLNSSRIITYSTRGMAEVYQTLGDVAASNKYALLTLTKSQDIGYLENVRNAEKILSDNYRSIGDFENAYAYFVKFSATKDTMFNTDKSREIQKLEGNFEIKQQQKEIEFLTAKNELQEQQSYQQRIIMLGLIIIITLIIILVIVQYRTNSLKQKSNQLLTEQKEQIEKQAALLEEANRSKDKLFSIISHDLKSPFGALLMITEQLDQQTFSQEELSTLKNALQGRVKSLSELLNNLLFWAKSQMEGASTEKETFDLKKLIFQNIAVFKQVADVKNIDLTAEIEEDCEVYADVNQIDCVLRNLINNAIKFTNKEGTISVSLTKLAHEIKVTVEDSGTGITEEIQASLFTSSAKMRMTGTENEVGSGLGLFLCQEFVEKNGGHIGVESELKRGSRFYFTIPNDSNRS
jgi:two-component system sensor histidine kinase/response regulator